MSLYDEILKLPQDYAQVLLYYKLTFCRVHMTEEFQGPEILTNCFDYHSNEDFRRPLFEPESLTLKYNCKETPCNCVNLGSCKFAHTSFEINYHPAKYKTISCLNFKSCSQPKALCPFLHENEFAIFSQLKNYIKSPPNQNVSVPLIKNMGNFPVFPSKTVIKLQLEKVNVSFEYPEKMIYFKVNLCPILEENHNWNQCEFYHNEKDRRRIIGNYSAERCYMKHCPKGDSCEFSHNDPEQLYHPDKYKKRLCTLYPNEIANCKFGEFCSFAHAEDEIRLLLLEKYEHNDEFNIFYYKTVWCPKNTGHDKASCVYAHNVQDFRRSPLEYVYDQDECKYWCKIDNKNKYEKGGCNKMMECNKCHGWKESEYHPFNYKKWKCTLGDSCKKKECAYLHSFDNKNTIQALVEIYNKKKLKFASIISKAAAKELKNNGKHFVHKPETSNFRQPILILDQSPQAFLPKKSELDLLKENNKPLPPKKPFTSQAGSRCQSLELSENTSNDSFHRAEKTQGFNKPPGFLSDSHDEKKINTEKTTKASLSRDSSVFIPGTNLGFFQMNNGLEGNSLKGEVQNKMSKPENSNRYLSCPTTPDYNKTDNPSKVGVQPKNYSLFEKKTLFTEEFKKRFEDMQISKVLEKLVNNLFLEENIKNMKKDDIDKFAFLTADEKDKVNLLLNEFRGVDA